MRRFLAALCLLILFLLPAAAQQCSPVDAKRIIAEGVEMLASGEIKGKILLGEDAVAFGKEFQIDAEMLSAGIHPNGERVILVLVINKDGLELACTGELDTSRPEFENIKKHFGPDAFAGTGRPA